MDDLYRSRVNFAHTLTSRGDSFSVWRWPDADMAAVDLPPLIRMSCGRGMWSGQSELTAAEARELGQALIAAADHAEGGTHA